MRRPRLLDLFCGAGGCAMGYHRAGFDVVGVDIAAQPRYPFEWLREDALEVLKDGAFVSKFDVIHASPPCQAYTPLRHLAGKSYPDLVAETRRLLNAAGKPWVIENVMGSPVAGIVLCGTMFALRVYRHRRFESTAFLVPREHPPHVVPAGEPGTKGGKRRKAHYMAGGFVTVCGNVGSYAGAAMGIDWMTGKELSQAIPPAYMEFIGRQLLAALKGVSKCP